MQKIATNVFIGASLAFGVLGIMLILIGTPDRYSGDAGVREFIQACIGVTVCVILSSFALSVAGKYLVGGSEDSRERPER